MIRFKLLLFGFICSFALSSCTNNCCNCCCYSSEEQSTDSVGIEYLESPAGLTKNENIIIWEPVLNADSYIVLIDDVQYVTLVNYLDISSLNISSGIHTVSVRSNNFNPFYIPSDYCKTIEFTL